MNGVSITDLLLKYKNQKPKEFGEYSERTYPVSAVISIIEELGINKHSMRFAEWLSENEWSYRKKGSTHPSKVGQYYSHIHSEYKSLEQLYDLFLLS